MEFFRSRTRLCRQQERMQQRESERARETERRRDRETERRETEIRRDRETDRQRDRETDRQTDRQPAGRTDGRTDRESGETRLSQDPTSSNPNLRGKQAPPEFRDYYSATSSTQHAHFVPRLKTRLPSAPQQYPTRPSSPWASRGGQRQMCPGPQRRCTGRRSGILGVHLARLGRQKWTSLEIRDGQVQVLQGRTTLHSQFGNTRGSLRCPAAACGARARL